jgi:hypothetical protein
MNNYLDIISHIYVTAISVGKSSIKQINVNELFLDVF